MCTTVKLLLIFIQKVKCIDMYLHNHTLCTDMTQSVITCSPVHGQHTHTHTQCYLMWTSQSNYSMLRQLWFVISMTLNDLHDLEWSSWPWMLNSNLPYFCLTENPRAECHLVTCLCPQPHWSGPSTWAVEGDLWSREGESASLTPRRQVCELLL